jgi:antitoxin (DNA-binding transcriptional repressor) of toxin-antitoxin stability system
MRAVGAVAMKKKFGELIGQAAQGEETVITQHGKPVAAPAAENAAFGYAARLKGAGAISTRASSPAARGEERSYAGGR